MHDDVSILPLAALQDIIGPHCNPFLTVAVSGTLAPNGLRFLVTDIAQGLPHDRALATIDYLRHLHDMLPPADRISDRNVGLIFQAEDVPIDMLSASWETKAAWHGITLVPDLYYFQGRGYENNFPGVLDWSDREAKIIWRGSTTGLFHQRLDDLDRLPRYQLARIMSELGELADVGLNAAVQAVDEEQESLIRERLISEGVFKPFLPMEEMTRFRYILDIDGNSNSWNFMMKLRLGCCVLRVESEWHQWFSERLRPWVHYVPIKRDFSDALQKVEWCLSNDAECAEIAAQGSQFARSMRFNDEMAQAASDLYLSQQIALSTT